ncbi:protein disulfide oxidoreductase domain protein [Metarhizium robertsii]|uniref:Thioredoxin-like fold protein n=2 Tax=Metarhizium robertsii TaxID=568076 RepID=E9ETP8_METRA|nr:Thioredoxin-like fold protein [Metarhizium robertsii ARSEF 23]EFZ00801.1 Thioredoxin-like fold protein [Metarhizium robertsii ARSEF 23]EXV03324.1 protein disulfide oxidoreductase domain protein [Metarhizium robertsii]
MTTYSTDPALYIFTSLTAGSSHIVTATSRLETILRANRIPFKAVDIATDEKARMLWGRRAGKDEGGRLRKLPGLVQEGLVLGDLVEIEDWNEYGELKQHVKIYYDEHTIPNIHNKPPEPAKLSKPAAKPAAASNTTVAPKAAPPMPEPKSGPEAATKAKHGPAESGKETTLPMRTVADEAAQKAKELNLKSLREKVHGTRVNDGSLESSSEPAIADSKSRTEDGEKTTDIKEQKPPGLQSPTSTAWKNKSGEDFLRETVQSPTSGRWRPNSVDATGVKTHNGARVVAASPEEIKQIEREQKIKEEPELEGGDEDKDKVAQKGKGDLKDGAKKDESKENEDEDNEDDEEENEKGRKRSEKAEKSGK